MIAQMAMVLVTDALWTALMLGGAVYAFLEMGDALTDLRWARARKAAHFVRSASRDHDVAAAMLVALSCGFLVGILIGARDVIRVLDEFRFEFSWLIQITRALFILLGLALVYAVRRQRRARAEWEEGNSA